MPEKYKGGKLFFLWRYLLCQWLDIFPLECRRRRHPSPYFPPEGVRTDVINSSGAGDEGMHSVGRAYDHQARFGMNVGNGEGTAGGAFRAWMLPSHIGEGGEQFHGWVWWQPDFFDGRLRITGGRDPWRRYGMGNIIGWAFNANNSEDWMLGWGAAGGYHYGATQRGTRLGRNAGFYAGFGCAGVSATFRPLDDLPLTLMLALPMEGPEVSDAGGNWLAHLLNAHFGARFTLHGVGDINFTWWGAPGAFGWGYGDSQVDDAGTVHVGAASGTNQTNSHRFFLSFLTGLPALQAMGLQFNVGFVYTAPFTVFGYTEERDLRTVFPLEFGLGVLYSQGPLRVAARLAATFAGTQDRWVEATSATATAPAVAAHLVTDNIPLQLGFNVHPRFTFGPAQFSLNAGIQIQAAADGPDAITYVAAHGDNMSFGWHATPYVTRIIAGPTRMFAGLHFESSGVRNVDGDIEVIWRVPVGIQLEW